MAIRHKYSNNETTKNDSDEKIIHFDDVSKSYYNDKNRLALDDINFAVQPGEFVSIVGHSGAGKSTLLKMMLAELYPTTGAVYINNNDTRRISKRFVRKMRRAIGIIFQDFRLIDRKTVYENIAFALEVAGMGNKEIHADVMHVLKLVDLKGLESHFPQQLSGGEQQRVAIARAIVGQPDILIADEPTGNLDPINTYEVVEILKKINGLGTTVVLTTHNKGVIDAIGGRVVTMDSGKIMKDDLSGKYEL